MKRFLNGLYGLAKNSPKNAEIIPISRNQLLLYTARTTDIRINIFGNQIIHLKAIALNFDLLRFISLRAAVYSISTVDEPAFIDYTNSECVLKGKLSISERLCISKVLFESLFPLSFIITSLYVYCGKT